MFRRRSLAAGQWPAVVRALLALALISSCPGSHGVARAQSTAPAVEPVSGTLRAVFEAAWARQPEAQALTLRRDAVRALALAARAWTPEPVALEVAARSDRLSRNSGLREHEVGVAVPLWLPGERSHSLMLADAEARAIESRATAAQLRLAATVRDAWWAWQRSRVELDAARGQLGNFRRISDDVARRVKAGELARADQHQADGTVAAAEAVVARSEAMHAAARLQIQALATVPVTTSATAVSSLEVEPDPPASASTTDLDAHTDLLAMRDRVAVAQGAAALTLVRSRMNPELTIATNVDRGNIGESYRQALTVGVRVPFGAGPRYDARVALARADLLELQAQWVLERARVVAEAESARVRTQSARVLVAASDRRAQLARESREFFDKSFRLGESDLPTRLRVEAEAAEADRQLVRARVELAAAISAWRQSLGLLPQ